MKVSSVVAMRASKNDARDQKHDILEDTFLFPSHFSFVHFFSKVHFFFLLQSLAIYLISPRLPRISFIKQQPASALKRPALGKSALNPQSRMHPETK